MTKRTTLCLVNVSGQAVREVSVTTTSGFEKGNAPSDFLKGGLANNDALCGFVELTGGRAWMTFQVTFDDSTVITFGLDQEDAYDKHVGVVPHEGPSPAWVWRTSGGSEFRFQFVELVVDCHGDCQELIGMFGVDGGIFPPLHHGFGAVE